MSTSPTAKLVQTLDSMNSLWQEEFYRSRYLILFSIRTQNSKSQLKTWSHLNLNIKPNTNFHVNESHCKTGPNIRLIEFIVARRVLA